jgi:hypothetical protein
MQVRPYDNEEQGIDRVVRSVLSWEASQAAAKNLDENESRNWRSQVAHSREALSYLSVYLFVKSRRSIGT